MRQHRWAIMWQDAFINQACRLTVTYASLLYTSTSFVAFNSLSTNLTAKSIALHKHLTRVARLILIDGGGLLSHLYHGLWRKEWNCFDASNASLAPGSVGLPFVLLFRPSLILPPRANMTATLKRPFAWKKKSHLMLQWLKEQKKLIITSTAWRF